MEETTSEQKEKEKLQRQNAKWLIEQKKKDALLRNDIETSKPRRKHENELSYKDYESVADNVSRFKDYKPDISIVHTDEHGRLLTPKEVIRVANFEAYKDLSHKFHGNRYGKKTIEKNLIKMNQEKRLMKMESGDTPLNMLSNLKQRQKAGGAAFITVATGNNVPVLPPQTKRQRVNIKKSKNEV